MNELQTINDVAITVKEHKGVRVVTFKDIDAVHGRPDGTARRNFNTNKSHLIEGEDYFVRNSYEAQNEFGIAAPNGLTLITESGYLMLVKSFTDDLAWEVQRELVKGYFRVKKSLSGAEQLLAQAQYLVEQERRLKAVEQKQAVLDGVMDVMAAPMLAEDGWQEKAQKAINTAVERFQTNHQTFRAELYEDVERVGHVDLETRQTRLRKRMKNAGATATECKGVSKLHVIARDPKLRPVFETLLKQKVIRMAKERGMEY
jgi:hypothetical protein